MIKRINLDLIRSFENHPFKIGKEDESLIALADSIKMNGLLNPLIVREKGVYYEMISGHRRKAAMKLVGIYEADCDVKDLTDDEAIIFMVDSNLQRERILPSERAFAYKMKLDAMKHQGKKIETCTQVVHKSKSIEILGEEFNESREKVRRFIRLTFLIPEILEMVDRGYMKPVQNYLTMSVGVAVVVSYLYPDEQKLLYNTMLYEDRTPNLSQAMRIKKLSEKKKINFNSLELILTEEKANQKETISFNKERIERVLPKELLNKDKVHVEKYIVNAINYYKKYEKRKMEDEEWG